ncbi:hypothetical protein [Hypericibacter sp.]|uniref:hypothetical protein n=1 Tax=Hypericibacter sp. TaxID=2705401 RepID=UPI003D6CE3EC
MRDDEAARRRQRLAEIGAALHGERWQTALAEDLGMASRHMRRLVDGTRAITDPILADAERLLARRRSEQTLQEIDRLAAEQGAPAEIRLTEGRDAVGRQATQLLAEALRARGIVVEIVKIGPGGDPAERGAKAASTAPQPLPKGRA